MNSLFTLLPTKMISKTDINGIKIDYEKYLTELINNSHYFMSLTGRIKFEKVLEQSHGEPDVVAGNYELDFKLLVNQEFVNAKLKSLPNVDYSHVKEGFISVNDKAANKGNLTQIQANGLFIRFMQRLALMKENQIEACGNDMENPLYSTVKMLKKEKNLLVFLPCIVNVDGCGISSVATTFLSSLFALRDNINNDTFATLLCQDGYFYILKYGNGGFRCFDKVHKLLEPSFNEIYSMTQFLETD